MKNFTLTLAGALSLGACQGPEAQAGADKDKIAARVKDYEDRFANPFVAAERGFLDEIIMPHSTRKRIARALDMLRHKELNNPWKKHDNIPL